MSKNFTLGEMCASVLADKMNIPNDPSEDVKKQLDFTMAGLERVRACLGHPMIILSGYRSPDLNRAVGGSKNSQHMIGQAADFISPEFGNPRAVADLLFKNKRKLGIDQLILEYSWVHVSFTLWPRYEVLTFAGGKYSQGIV